MLGRSILIGGFAGMVCAAGAFMAGAGLIVSLVIYAAVGHIAFILCAWRPTVQEREIEFELAALIEQGNIVSARKPRPQLFRTPAHSRVALHESRP